MVKPQVLHQFLRLVTDHQLVKNRWTPLFVPQTCTGVFFPSKTLLSTPCKLKSNKTFKLFQCHDKTGIKLVL